MRSIAPTVPFVGTKAGLRSFERIVGAEETRESDRRWRCFWLAWAIAATSLAFLFLGPAVAFAVLYVQQYPQCSLKDMHFAADVAEGDVPQFPILQSGTAFYRNPAYEYKPSACEAWLLRDLDETPPPPHADGPLNGVRSVS